MCRVRMRFCGLRWIQPAVELNIEPLIVVRLAVRTADLEGASDTARSDAETMEPVSGSLGGSG